MRWRATIDRVPSAPTTARAVRTVPSDNSIRTPSALSAMPTACSPYFHRAGPQHVGEDVAQHRPFHHHQRPTKRLDQPLGRRAAQP
ncbi:hypothetical protein ACT16_17340 [Mycobacterium heckeshornense]|nr:hypothetical protein ACT16_17340 [Mycobacterium heckeshornense]